MSVLSNIDIVNAMNEDEGIIIMNMRDKSITGLGYDLTIGFIRDADTGEEPETCADDSNRYTLISGHRYLVISKEFVYISSGYMATLHSRGSYALKGIVVASTTVDPNYAGCITGSLINCTSKDIHIKKTNQFVTMVIHKLCTPTNILLQKNEHNRYMDTQETLHGKFPNIHPKACEAADAYYGEVRKQIEYEYIAARERIYAKSQAKNDKQAGISIGQMELEGISVQKDVEKITQTDLRRKKITFLVGNGFDLNVGLDTKYSDFYHYYIKADEHDMLAKEIQDNVEAWSDLELAIGKVTEKISASNEGEFRRSEKNLENSLVNYLENQMNRIDLQEEKERRRIGFEMQTSLTEFYKKFPEKEREAIEKILPDSNEQIEYSFISFNYTDVLDRCLRTATERFLVNLCPVGDKDILHIHGTTSAEMVLGVNDVSQIANKEFAGDISNREDLIKEEINNTSYGNTKIKRARAVIDGSSIICIFGMSLGATDKMWWQYIAKWLQKDETRRLVIFAKDDEVSKIGKYANKCKRDMKQRFRNNGELGDALWEQIEGQIYVKVNADIFNLKLV